MAEEIQELLKDEGKTGEAVHAETSARSETRIKDLADKLKENEGKFNAQLEAERQKASEALKKSQELEFELGITKMSSQFPDATKFRDEIKTHVGKGLSVEDATTLVLAKNQRFTTTEQRATENADNSSVGGSSVTAMPKGTKDPQSMTQDERRAVLLEKEKNGDFGIDDGGTGFFIK